jgi:hypothetical protein
MEYMVGRVRIPDFGNEGLNTPAILVAALQQAECLAGLHPEPEGRRFDSGPRHVSR